nr:MAG TPA: hypothetical protein [Caudoviricetes sp.]
MLHIHCRRTRLGDGSPVHGFQSSSPLSRNAGIPVLAESLQVRLTASHRRPRHRP